MRIQKVFLLLLLMAGSALAGTVFYNNIVPSNDTWTVLPFSVGPYDGIGDSVGFGSPVVANHAILELFNAGDGGGTFDATLQFYDPGSPVGSAIGGYFSLTGVSVGAASVVDIDFALGSLNLPANAVFLLQLSNVSDGLDLGVELYWNPPAVGTNTPDTAIVLQGGAYSALGTGGGNPAFELTAVPEPQPSLLIVSAFAIVLWRYKRSAERKRISQTLH